MAWSFLNKGWCGALVMVLWSKSGGTLGSPIRLGTRQSLPKGGAGFDEWASFWMNMARDGVTCCVGSFSQWTSKKF